MGTRVALGERARSRRAVYLGLLLRSVALDAFIYSLSEYVSVFCVRHGVVYGEF